MYLRFRSMSWRRPDVCVQLNANILRYKLANVKNMLNCGTRVLNVFITNANFMTNTQSGFPVRNHGFVPLICRSKVVCLTHLCQGKAAILVPYIRFHLALHGPFSQQPSWKEVKKTNTGVIHQVYLRYPVSQRVPEPPNPCFANYSASIWQLCHLFSMLAHELC